MFDWIKRNFKTVVRVLLSIVSAIGIIILFKYTGKETRSTDITIFSNIIMFILTTIISIIISYYFSKTSNEEKIDTIAMASVEKMANLSIQMKHINDFLTQSYKEIINDTIASDKDTIVLLFKHKIKSINEMLNTLTTSNETLRADWLGVVSSNTKKEIETTYQKLKEYFNNWKELDVYKNAESLNEDDSHKVSEIIGKMQSTEKELNFISQNTTAPIFGPAVRVNQEIKTQTNGTLTIEIIRQTYLATGSGKIAPLLDNVPVINVKLISNPAETNEKEFFVNPGCGTNFDFNISIKSKILNKYLSNGKYVFEYNLVEQEHGA